MSDIEIAMLIEIPLMGLGLRDVQTSALFVKQHWSSLAKCKTVRQFFKGTRRLAYRYEPQVRVLWAKVPGEGRA